MDKMTNIHLASKSTGNTCVAILCTVLGGCVFVSIFGHQILDPTFINWTLKGDAGIHFLGWHFFRSEPWTFPLGTIKSYMYPQGTSLVFTDSIPLVAIPLKLFSSILPKPFQYHGLWLLLNYMLHGYVGAKLLRQITHHPIQIIIGVSFFLLSPIMANKTVFHEALTTHWLLLAALYLYLCPDDQNKQYNWLGLLVISSLIHFYLFFMVGVLWTAYLVRIKLEGATTATLLRIITTTSAMVILTMWVAGYFIINLDSAATADFGVGSMNLLAPLFPTSRHPFTFPATLPLASRWQVAGENYLGMGTLLLITLAIYERTAHQASFNLKKYLPLLGAAIFLFLLAITNKVTLADLVLFEIKLPTFLERIMSVIRASGRMFWPLAYLLIVTSIAVVTTYNTPKRATTIMTIMLMLQIIDCWPWYSNFNLATRHIVSSPLQSPEWPKIIKDIDHIALIPPTIEGDDYIPFALLAATYGKTINVGAVARTNAGTSNNKDLDDFIHDTLDARTLYIIKDNRLSHKQTSPKVKMRVLDGYYIANADQ